MPAVPTATLATPSHAKASVRLDSRAICYLRANLNAVLVHVRSNSDAVCDGMVACILPLRHTCAGRVQQARKYRWRLVEQLEERLSTRVQTVTTPLALATLRIP